MTQYADAALFAQRMEEIQRARLDGYKRQWNYYNGDQPNTLKVREGQPDDNVTINLARLVVDKGAAFLFGKEPQFELQEGETTPEEERLAAIWRANRKQTFLGKLATSGGIYGHAFLKIIPDYYGAGLARLVSIEPENITAYWDGDDIESIWRYCIEYIAADRDGTAIVKRQEIERISDSAWRIQNRISRRGTKWEPDPANPDGTWNRPYAPIIDCQNLPLPGAYYGVSDLDDLVLQDTINYVTSNVVRILRYHAHPRTIGRGFAPNDIKVAADETLVLPSMDSDLRNLEMQSDLGSSLALMDRLIGWMLATARIPRIDPAVINVGALSGFALRVLYGDLLEKTEQKRNTYGDLLIELNRRLLDLAGMGDDHVMTIHWADPLPGDQGAATERDKFELDYALASKETVRVRRGLDNKAEEARIDAEAGQSAAREGNIGEMLLRSFERGGVGGAE